MKKIVLVFFAVVAIANTILAQDTTISLAKAGTLSTVLSTTATKFASLKITGSINAQDFRTMRTLCETTLKTIDLREANIVSYSGKAGTYFEISSWGAKYDNVSYSYFANNIPINAFACYADSYGYFATSVLETIYLPNSTYTIEKNAFRACVNLKNLYFNDNNTLKFIEIGAISQCFKLETLTFPKKLIRIDPNICHIDSALTDLYFQDTTVLFGSFNNKWVIPATCKIHAPCFGKNYFAKQVVFKTYEIVDACKKETATETIVDKSFIANKTIEFSSVEKTNKKDSVILIDSFNVNKTRKQYSMFNTSNTSFTNIETKTNIDTTIPSKTNTKKLVDSLQTYSIEKLNETSTKINISTEYDYDIDSIKNISICTSKINSKDSVVKNTLYYLHTNIFDTVFAMNKTITTTQKIDSVFNVSIDTIFTTKTSTITTSKIYDTISGVVYSIKKDTAIVIEKTPKTNNFQSTNTSINKSDSIVKYTSKTVDYQYYDTTIANIAIDTFNVKDTTKTFATKAIIFDNLNTKEVKNTSLVLNVVFEKVNTLNTQMQLNEFIEAANKLNTVSINEIIENSELIIAIYDMNGITIATNISDIKTAGVYIAQTKSKIFKFVKQ